VEGKSGSFLRALCLVRVNLGDHVGGVGAAIQTLEDGVFPEGLGMWGRLGAKDGVEAWVYSHLATFEQWGADNIANFVKSVIVDVGLDQVAAIINFVPGGTSKFSSTRKFFQCVGGLENFSDDDLGVANVFIREISRGLTFLGASLGMFQPVLRHELLQPITQLS